MDSESNRRKFCKKLDKTGPNNTNMDQSQLLNVHHSGKDANMQCDSSGGLIINVSPHYYSTKKLSSVCKLEIDHSDMSGF